MAEIWSPVTIKMNPILRSQITNAVGAICGMVEMTEGPKISSDKLLVGITAFGLAEVCVIEVFNEHKKAK